MYISYPVPYAYCIMKTQLLTALGLGSLFILASCTKDVGPDPALQAPDSCDSVKFSTMIKPIIEASCSTSGCHDGSPSVPGNFTGFTDISLSVQNGSFKKRVVDGSPNFMPSSGRLPQADIDKITCWLNAGAPNN